MTITSTEIIEDSAQADVSLGFNSGTSVSSVGRTAWFDWSSGTTGEIRMTLGGTTVSPGMYDTELLVYDITNTSGVNWGTIPILVKG